jgi:hydrophobe/amphiphile efflux-1 (HAE1) family protein
MKNISAWAIRNPIPPLVLFMVLLFMGISAFIRLPINNNPDIAYPMVDVVILQPGASPSEMERQILQKVEGSIASIGNVHKLTSRALEGQALTFVEFQIGTPIDRAVADVRDAVAKVRAELPQSIQEPLISREDFDGGPIVYYAVSSTAMSVEQVSWFIDNTVTKRLVARPGVARVQRSGGVDREIRIDLDPARMQALGLTAAQVNQQLKLLNQDAPGGRADVAGGEQSIRVLGGAHSAAALAATQIPVAGGRSVRLSDIADVRDGYAEVRTIARLNGQPATTFNVTRAKGFSDVNVLNEVRKELAKISAETPQFQVTQIFTTVDYTKQDYRSAIDALLEGSLLAVAVVFLFLREWRSTAIAALAIPLSAIPTFAFMQWMGFTLNFISLLALSLVAGVLVDDAIVEIENIVRHMRKGKTGYQAALDAADEIGLAVVATSATIIAVFLPVSFMTGISGQFFKQFGLTVAAAVFISLMVARLVTPVIAAFTLRPEHGREHKGDGPIMAWYLGFLRTCMRHRWATCIAGFFIVVITVAAALLTLSTSFIPPEDVSNTTVNVELPPGVRVEDTARVTSQIAAIVKRRPEVKQVLEVAGSDDDGQVRTGRISIVLTQPHERKMSQKDWELSVEPELKRIPDARISFQSQGNGDGRDVSLYVTGDDPGRVEAAARQLVREMTGLKELRTPRVNGDLPHPELVIHPRFDVAAQLGVTVDDISQTVRIATLGDLPQYAAKFSVGDRQIPIRVGLVESARKDLSTIENLPVPTASGGSVPLKAVAEITFGQGPTAVRRYMQQRRMLVDADLAKGVQLGDAMKKIDALPAATKNLPQGVRILHVGDAEIMDELMTNFMLAIGAGILMVFAVLVLLFARVLQPLVILGALPLSIGGVVLALLVTNQPISLAVMIGILMLMGIVAKNSILLVDFAIVEMRAGRDRVTAMMEAAHKRARPIVMTSVAMIAGMLPVALNVTGNNQFRAPMAIAVIGGLVTSTALTLVIVPAAFSIVDSWESWLGPRAARILSGEARRTAAVRVTEHS